MSKRKYLSAAYDKRAVFEEIKPLLEKVHKFCHKNDIPYVFAANLVVDTENDTHETCSSAMLIGPERTPPELAIAHIAVTNGISDAVAMAAVIMSHVNADAESNDDADQPEWPAHPASVL